MILLLLLLQMSGIHGRVLDASTNEPLARVQVQAGERRVITADDGTFRIADLAPGEYVLHASTVGYYLLRQNFTLAAGESREFEIVLTTSSKKLQESVDVTAKPFEAERQESPAQLTLAGNEMKNLSSVLADDPLRAVQGLPGVTSNNDFNAQFSLRGADFSRIGLYLDGILLHQPFHAVEGQGQDGSMTAFNGDILEDMTLYEGAWPVSFADRTAGILSVNTRDGNRKQTTFRASASMTDASVLGEGPVGDGDRASWMASYRKSYLQYLLDRVDPSNFPALVFGFSDFQGKLTYDLTPKHTLSITLLDGESSLDRSSVRSQLGVNALLFSNYHFTLLNLASRYTPNQKFLVSSHMAWSRERGSSTNPTSVSLGADGYGDWTGRSDATWIERDGFTMRFGGNFSRLRDDGTNYEYQSSSLVELDRFRGTALRTGVYAQQTWSALRKRVQLTTGARFDHTSVSPVQTVSPYASLAIQLRAATRLQFAWGQYAQYPELSQSFSIFGSPSLLPERSTHVEAAIEQSFGDKTRLRLEFYDRQDRDLLARPLFDPRLLTNGTVFFAPNSAPWANSERGYSRGVQVLLQRRTANGFTGWISYAYGVANVTDGVLHLNFPTDNDQRHTVNVFGSYRLRPTVNLSVKWLYGSGFPIPGFYRTGPAATPYLLSVNRNQLRFSSYQRLDFRVNKAWAKDKWKTTLFAEVVNLTNHSNLRFDSFDGYNGKTGQAFPTFFNMFPILPSVGVVFER